MNTIVNNISITTTTRRRKLKGGAVASYRQWYVNFRDPKTGKRIRRAKDRKKDAEAYKAELIRKFAQGSYVDERTAPTVGQAVDHWLEDKNGKVKVLEAWGPNAPCSNLDDGRIKKIRNAVVDTASKVEFEPPADEGKPSDVEMTVSYSFDSSGQPFRASTRSEAKGRIVEAGVLMGRVKHLAKPDYPLTARANRLGGTIPISVLVDIDGKVIAASALGGHKILQGPALIAACRSSIEPVQLSGVPVQVSGVILFAFLS